jgi:hypothetical protein
MLHSPLVRFQVAGAPGRTITFDSRHRRRRTIE